MKVLTGELDAQKGTVVRPRKFGVLRQDQFAFDAYRVIDTVIMATSRFGRHSRSATASTRSRK